VGVILRRKQREWTELATDPQLPLMVGRLLGANEMAVALLGQQGETDNARHIAEVLARQTAWFFNDSEEPSSAVTGTMKTLGIGER
jgi:hypothetical protein